MGAKVQPITPPDYLRRLSPESYRGFAMIHWCMTVDARRTGWLNARSHALWREILLHTLARYQLAAPVYCLMPDHVHVVLVGLGAQSDQRRAMSFLRRYSGPAMFAERGAGWQKQPYDHVLRDRERSRGADGFAAIVHYIAENPVRAGLVEKSSGWPYAGSVIAGWPDLQWRREDFGERWWKVYGEATDRAEDCTEAKAP